MTSIENEKGGGEGNIVVVDHPGERKKTFISPKRIKTKGKGERPRMFPRCRKGERKSTPAISSGGEREGWPKKRGEKRRKGKGGGIPIYICRGRGKKDAR